MAMGDLDYFPYRHHRSQGVRNLRDRNQLRLVREKLLVLIEQNLPRIIHGDHPEFRALCRGELLPWDYVGMVLQPTDDDLVTFTDILFSPSLRHQVDGFRSAP